MIWCYAFILYALFNCLMEWQYLADSEQSIQICASNYPYNKFLYRGLGEIK